MPFKLAESSLNIREADLNLCKRCLPFRFPTRLTRRHEHGQSGISSAFSTCFVGKFAYICTHFKRIADETLFISNSRVVLCGVWGGSQPADLRLPQPACRIVFPEIPFGSLRTAVVLPEDCNHPRPLHATFRKAGGGPYPDAFQALRTLWEAERFD